MGAITRLATTDVSLARNTPPASTYDGMRAVSARTIAVSTAGAPAAAIVGEGDEHAIERAAIASGHA
ncbi:MAG: hypothetical protein HY048_07720 [Acidobacteria bacterium]|nr:hypothetical protein [Acidobacteriota bacterium]